MAKHLVVEGMEAWPLPDDTDVYALRQGIRAAMERGSPLEVAGDPGSDGTGTRVIVLNSARTKWVAILDASVTRPGAYA